MAIDRDKFQYRIGDKVRNKHSGEWEVIGVTKYGYTSYYRIKNLSPGCLDQPTWITELIIFSNYEPCNTAIKVLFDRGSKATPPSVGVVSAEPKHGGLDGDTD